MHICVTCQLMLKIGKMFLLFSNVWVLFFQQEGKFLGKAYYFLVFFFI